MTRDDDDTTSGLGRFMRAGQEQGRALLRGDPLAHSPSSTVFDDARRQLDEAKAHAGRGGLIHRASALSSVRGLDRLLDTDDPRGLALRAEAAQLRRRVLDEDEREFAGLRAALRAGEYTPHDWAEDLRSRSPFEQEAFTTRLLGLQDSPMASRALEDDMVHFVASSLDSVVEVANLVGPDDVFYDVGCGTGRVALLVQWLTGATVRGIEYDGAYVAAANAAKAALGLDVDFIEGDARAFTYEDATVVYAFEPFRGAVMTAFLDRLRAKMAPFILLSRFVVVDGMAEVPWLTLVDTLPSGLRRYEPGQRQDP